MLILAGILWISKLVVFAKLNPEDTDNFQNTYYWDIFFNGIAIGIDVFSDFLFFYMIGVTGWWFIFFKFQSFSFVLLPSLEDTYNENYKFFMTLITIVYVFKSVSTLYKIVYKKSQTDLFFIDW